jgi:hypothetical protein
VTCVSVEKQFPGPLTIKRIEGYAFKMTFNIAGLSRSVVWRLKNVQLLFSVDCQINNTSPPQIVIFFPIRIL